MSGYVVLNPQKCKSLHADSSTWCAENALLFWRSWTRQSSTSSSQLMHMSTKSLSAPFRGGSEMPKCMLSQSKFPKPCFVSCARKFFLHIVTKHFPSFVRSNKIACLPCHCCCCCWFCCCCCCYCVVGVAVEAKLDSTCRYYLCIVRQIMLWYHLLVEVEVNQPMCCCSLWSFPLNLPLPLLGIFNAKVLESDDLQLPWSQELSHKASKWPDNNKP